MRKKSFNIILLMIGVILIALSFTFLKGEAYKTFNGACLGIGAGAIGLAFSNLLMLHWYHKHPKELKQAEIDSKDERSEIIRNKAKAKCSIRRADSSVIPITHEASPDKYFEFVCSPLSSSQIVYSLEFPVLWQPSLVLYPLRAGLHVLCSHDRTAYV